MRKFVFTEAGNKWAASALSGVYNNPDAMFIVYDNGNNSVLPDINTTTDKSYFDNLVDPVGCVSVNDGIGVYTLESDNGYSSVYSVVMSPVNTTVIGGASHIPGTSKIVAVALVAGEKVLAVGELSNPIVWAANTSISVSIPITIPAGIQEDGR